VSDAAVRLTIELVPATSWGDNLRTRLRAAQWDKIRRKVYADAGSKCQICGGVGPRHPVECHEIWSYDDSRGVQALAGLIALCPACHEVKHMGYAEVTGNGRRARAHLALINGWTDDQAWKHRCDAMREWSRRSKRDWDVDLSWLYVEHGIDPSEVNR
jgi:hypothetical protein